MSTTLSIKTVVTSEEVLTHVFGEPTELGWEVFDNFHIVKQGSSFVLCRMLTGNDFVTQDDFVLPNEVKSKLQELDKTVILDTAEDGALYVAYCQEWTEFERGWGQRSDGYSLHATKELALKERVEILKHIEKFNNPEEYSMHTGEPFAVQVAKSTFMQLKSGRMRVVDSKLFKRF